MKRLTVRFGFAALLSCSAVPAYDVAETGSARIQINNTVSIASFGPFNLANFRAAANYLCTHPNTELYFPPGTYNITETVDFPTYLSGASAHSVTFNGCSNVVVAGTRATIVVNGNFTKNLAQGSSNAADTYAITPFYFVNSHDFVVRDLEIYGQVDLMTVTAMRPPPTIIEGAESAFELDQVQDFSLIGLNIHHMAADGISFGSSAARGVVDGTTISYCDRNLITFGYGVRDIAVTNTSLIHPGETQSNAFYAYPAHAPRAAVDIEPECVALGLPNNGTRLCGAPNYTNFTGNLLFDHVTVVTNNTQGIAGTSADASANVTIQNSTFTSVASLVNGAPPYPAAMFRFYLPGVVVKNSTIDLSYDTPEACFQGLADQRDFGSGSSSGVMRSYLADLANDAWIAQHPMYTEQRPLVSTTFLNNTIKGKRTLLTCSVGIGDLQVLQNHFIGQQDSTINNDTPWKNNMYGNFVGTAPSGANYAPHLKISGNWFEVPNSAPPTGQMVLSGNLNTVFSYYLVNELSGNKYSSDRQQIGSMAFVAAYQKLGFAPTVIGDHFPDNSGIVASDYALYPYPLTTCTINNVDCFAGFTKTLNYP